MVKGMGMPVGGTGSVVELGGTEGHRYEEGSE